MPDVGSRPPISGGGDWALASGLAALSMMFAGVALTLLFEIERDLRVIIDLLKAPPL